MRNNFFPLKNLLSFRKPEEVVKFLTSLDKDSYTWENIGNDETNFPRLAISKSSVRAIIERITNCIDAVLENQKITRKDVTDNTITTPRGAVEKWFGVKGGHIGFLGEKERRKMARENIEVILDDSGNEKKPTVTIIDQGVGIHPDEFSKTVVGLGGSLKRGKQYLLGAYGWGGSQTFIWCNGAVEATDVESLPLAIIVSRKNPKLLDTDQKDEVGWTIVRYRDIPNEKHGVFQYLVDKNKNIPRTFPEHLPESFSHGTQIIHLAYDLERFHGRMTLASYRLFQSLLFDPVLPFWLYDNRYEDGRTISGNLSRLSTDEKSIVEYQNTENREMPFGGSVKIRYWALRTKKDGGFHIESYIERTSSPNTIFITLNGQQYGTLSKQIIKDSGFSFLSDFILFQIECDSLPVHAKKSIFPSTREDIRENYKEILKNEIISILQSDEELKKLEEARKQESLSSGDEESIKRVRRLLDKLISVNKIVIKGGGKGEKKKKKEYKGKDPPTKLIILPENKDLEIITGEEKKVTVETDATNDFLTRDDNPGTIDCFIDPEMKCSIRSGFLRNGKINFYIRADNNVSVGTKGRLKCRLEVPGIVKLESSKNIEVVNTPPPLPSNYPPSVFEIFNEENPLHIKRGRRSLITIRCDGPDGLLERPEDKANLNISFLPDIGVKVIGRSDLSRHKIRVFLQCPENVEIGKRTEIFCKLELAEKTPLTSKRNCTVIMPPPSSGGEEGVGDIEVPNYDVIPVEPDDKNWIQFQWDDTNVGTYKKSGDSLLLYVSLGNKHYLNSLENKSLPTDKVRAFKDKYLSYIGFHLWLMSEEKSENGLTDEKIQAELRRICQTVLLTLDQDSQFR